MTADEQARLRRAVERAPVGRKQLRQARLYDATHADLRRCVEGRKTREKGA